MALPSGSGKRFATDVNLTEEEANQIAHAIAQGLLRERFKLCSSGDYARSLNASAADIGVEPEKLHQYLVSVLPVFIGKMFGWSGCSITGSGGKPHPWA